MRGGEEKAQEVGGRQSRAGEVEGAEGIEGGVRRKRIRWKEGKAGQGRGGDEKAQEMGGAKAVQGRWGICRAGQGRAGQDR